MTFDRQGRPAAIVQLAMAHRLTLVVAAAGWGKSSLLRALSDAAPSIEARRPGSGWTALALARSLSVAISAHTGIPNSGELPATPSADAVDHVDQASALAGSVCATAAAALHDDTLIIVDDFDDAGDESLEQFLETLILGIPPRAHLVVACRRRPNLRIARLRAAGEVADVTSEDLAITPADVSGLGLDAQQLASVLDIIRATGGWPIAVHLAVEAAKRELLDRVTLVDRLLAPNAILFDFLAEEVLAGTRPAEQALLMLAAHVPALSSQLLADIGLGDFAADLDHLEQQRIFLEPVLGRPGHVRSSLVGGTFVRRALPKPPKALLDAVVEALRRAGDFENALVLSTCNGDPRATLDLLLSIEEPQTFIAAEVLDHALDLAGNDRTDPRLAELRGDLAYQRGAWDDALRHYGEAERLGGRSTATLARKRAGLLYLRGRLDEADAICEVAHGEGDGAAERSRLLVWRAVIAWARGDDEGCERFVEPALELAHRSADDGALAAAYTARGMLAALRGDLPANTRFYDTALRHAERANDVAQIVRIRTNRGSRLTEQGQYHEAITELETALTIAELAGSETFSALAYNNRGEAHLALGHLEQALADLRRAQEIWTRLGSNRILYALNSIGLVQLLRGQRSEAIALFNEAIRIASSQRDAQGLVPAYVGLANSLELDDPEAAATAARRAIEANHAMWMPHAYLAAGSAARRAGDREAAAHWARRATELARTRQDRPALAEALQLTALLESPPSSALAQQASRLWRDLGNPIGVARADLIAAQSMPGRRRDELVADAERTLQEVGAWGLLADIRREFGEGTTSSVNIATLGGFRVSRDADPIDIGEWGSRKARDVLKLLVARRGAPVVRDEMTELLWPDEPDRSARRLSVLLSTVRTVLDPGKVHPADHFIAADHDTVWLVRDHVDIDVESFLAEAAAGRRLLASGDREKAKELLGDAAARYLGEFCADDPYADWAAGLRALAKHTFVDTCFELAGLADDADEFSEAIRNWLRILDVDPYDEDAHLGLINSLLSQRRHGEARRAYRAYCTRMAELDLDAAPFPNDNGTSRSPTARPNTA